MKRNRKQKENASPRKRKTRGAKKVEKMRKHRVIKKARKRQKTPIVSHTDGLKPHEWELYQSVSRLLNEAIETRNLEATLYFAGELKKLGGVDRIEKSAISETQTHYPRRIEVRHHRDFQEKENQNELVIEKQQEETQPVYQGKQKRNKGRSTINFARPLSDFEKRVFSTVVSSQPPRDKQEFAAQAFADQPNMRSSTIGVTRSIQALRHSLSKIRHLLATKPFHEEDKAFLEAIKETIPASVSEFDAFASGILARYGARDTTLQIPEASGLSYVPPSSSVDWLRLLYTAFFHPHGATLNAAAIAERTGMDTEVAEASIDGALAALQESWENSNDRNVRAFIAMVKKRWPEKTLSEIRESLT